MKKWLRWQGIIGFFVITFCIVVFFYFFAGRLIKHAVEFTGTKAVGAKVELIDADIKLFPVGISLTGLSISDPYAPMQNAVEIGNATLLLDTGSIFLRKLIVNEMIVKEVRFNTIRESSGAITDTKQTSPEKAKKTSQKKEWKMPDFDVQSIDSILKKESLSLTKNAEKMKKKITDTKNDYQKKLELLPDKKSFDEYKARMKKLKKGKGGLDSILGKAREAKKLRSDITNDINSLKKVRNDLQKNIHFLNKDITKLKDQAKSDYQSLKNKYAISPKGIGNISALVFGPKYSGWVEKGLSWYIKLKPYLKNKDKIDKTDKSSDKNESKTKTLRGKGIDIRFLEYHPMPEFLIKKAGVSLQIPAGNISGSLENISNEQDITGLPLVFQFSGNNLKQIKSVTAEGELNRVSPILESDTFSISADGIHLTAFDLIKSKDLEIKLEKAESRFDFNAVLKGENIDSTIKIDLSSVSFSNGNTPKKGLLANAIGKSLSDVKKFSLYAKITGTLDNYNLNISSDIDTIIKKTVSGIAKQLSKEFANKLKATIDDKTKEQIKDIKKQIGGLGLIDNEITQRLDMAKALL